MMAQQTMKDDTLRPIIFQGMVGQKKALQIFTQKNLHYIHLLSSKIKILKNKKVD
jgi:hypothetical protein